MKFSLMTAKLDATISSAKTAQDQEATES